MKVQPSGKSPADIGTMRIAAVLGDAAEDAFALTEDTFRAAASRHPAAFDRMAVVFLKEHELERQAGLDVDCILGLQRPAPGFVARVSGLRWLHVLASGVDAFFPFDWLPGGVVMTNSRGAHRSRAAEFARLAILMLGFRIPQIATRQRQHLWLSDFTPTLAGQKLVVVGLGVIGSEVARAGRAFGMRVTGVRRSSRASRHVDRLATPSKLPALLADADMLFLAAPLTPETAGMIGPAELARMKPTASIVNVGRSGLIDTTALVKQLESGRLGAAILDVFDREPLPASSPLWDVPNLTILPHVSVTDSARYLDLMLDIFFDNVLRLASGRPLRNRVSLRAGY